MDIDPDLIAAVLQWHRLGVKPGNIAGALQATGYRLPPGSSTWNADTVKAILKVVERGAEEAEIEVAVEPATPTPKPIF